MRAAQTPMMMKRSAELEELESSAAGGPPVMVGVEATMALAFGRWGFRARSRLMMRSMVMFEMCR